MKRFVASVVALTIGIALMVSGCKQSEKQSAALGDTKGAVAGIQWRVPKVWTVGPERPMRVASYAIPAASGDAEGGECAVFHFEGGQGGPLDANIERWAGQFEGSPQPTRSSKEVNGLKVELVQIEGTYLSPGGPMMQSTGKKENYRLYGAIVEAPQGLVFFKLTGPKKTVEAADVDFNALIGSFTK
jgi:hypothetical protein